MSKPTGRPRGRPRKHFYLGVRFSRLVVIDDSNHGLNRRVLVRCDCGTEKTVLIANLVSGDTKSCGCLQREQAGQPRERREITPEYRAWCGMIQRCTNPQNKHWKYYGGRGITVSPEWIESCEAFLAHMGKRPGPNYSLDRYPNNNRNYEPGNCRWATPKEQMQNTRYNRLMTINGVTHCHSEWARRLGVSNTFLRYRLERGMAKDKEDSAQTA